MDSAQQYLVEEELEHYRDGLITRREFVRRATLLGAGAATAAAMVGTVVRAPKSFAAPAAMVSPFSVAADDPMVTTDWVSYTSTDGAGLAAYLAWPSSAQSDHSLPGVVICHANRGVTEHVMDVARRFAKQGYVALSPDLPSRSGRRSIDFADQSELLLAFRDLNSQQNALDFSAGLSYVANHPAVDLNKLAATGYCFGGGVIWRLATIAPNLRAAAPFYGSNPPMTDCRTFVQRCSASTAGWTSGSTQAFQIWRPRWMPPG
jgi:carboxymethylenebutenolidase